jgi:hypothetical protein
MRPYAIARPVPFPCPRPRRDTYAKGMVTAARKGAEARAAGLPSTANPNRATDAYVAWREGWESKDRELRA